MSNSPKHEPTAAAVTDEKKKQQITIVVIVAVLAVIAIVALVFILKPSGGGTSSSPLYPDGVIPTSGSRHDVSVLPDGGADAGELGGKWRIDKNTVYEFDGYGRGILHTAVDDYSFAYSAEDGHLNIDFDTDKGNDRDYKYTVEGETLTISLDDAVYTMTKEI